MPKRIKPELKVPRNELKVASSATWRRGTVPRSELKVPRSEQQYQTSLAERYATPEMLYNFSAEKKFRTWRSIWIALAETERTLGLPIKQDQINQMKRFRNRISYDKIRRYEQSLKHEVIAHIRAYADQCPKAKPIIHLGATSALVIDNADLIILRDALTLIKQQLIDIISALAKLAQRYKNLLLLGFTHFQPALVTTLGKRVCLWLNDLLMDWKNLEFIQEDLKSLGAKGAIGTQASFLTLFNHNRAKVKQLDRLFTKKLGFTESYPLTSQTYSRKLDYQILSVLSGIAQSAHKFSNDLRLLQGLGEIEEPFGNHQVGSSAMAYKRNPIRSERMAALARFIIVTVQNTAFTSAGQWLERTLDDSANKRLVIPEAFLATDALLNIYLNVVSGLKIYPTIMRKHLEEKLPFLVTEDIIMQGVKSGGDRQELHERLRRISMQTVGKIRQGKPDNLIARLQNDPLISKTIRGIKRLLDPARYTGLSREQTESFLRQNVQPLLRHHKALLRRKTKSADLL